MYQMDLIYLNHQSVKKQGFRTVFYIYLKKNQQTISQILKKKNVFEARYNKII